ncbi:MAG: SulP family inorganic anion transporter [Steroidobacteraceae bacterium]
MLLVTAPNLLQHLPSATLAAVVIASAIGLVEVGDLRRIYRIQRWEFWLSIVCFIGVAVLGAVPRHRNRDRDRGDRVSLGRLAPPLGGARSG